MDHKVDHLIYLVRIAQDLIPRNNEGKEINTRLNSAIEAIKTQDRNDRINIRSNAKD